MSTTLRRLVPLLFLFSSFVLFRHLPGTTFPMNAFGCRLFDLLWLVSYDSLLLVPGVFLFVCVLVLLASSSMLLLPHRCYMIRGFNHDWYWCRFVCFQVPSASMWAPRSTADAAAAGALAPTACPLLPGIYHLLPRCWLNA